MCAIVLVKPNLLLFVLFSIFCLDKMTSLLCSDFLQQYCNLQGFYKIKMTMQNLAQNGNILHTKLPNNFIDHLLILRNIFMITKHEKKSREKKKSRENVSFPPSLIFLSPYFCNPNLKTIDMSNY